MLKCYVPYQNGTPAAVDVKGHKLLVLTTSADELTEGLDLVGGDEIRTVDIADPGDGKLAALAKTVEAGVVLAPPDVSIEALIRSLEHELTWLH